MDHCPVCGREIPVSRAVGACLYCIRTRPGEILPEILKRHAVFRSDHGLVKQVPRDPQGLTCGFCVNSCSLPEGQTGFCGVRKNIGGRIEGGVGSAPVTWYHDELPTNCVASWVCPAGSNAGYPEFSYTSGPEKGYTNLAVFYQACTFHCLNCQNWRFRDTDLAAPGRTPEEISAAVTERDACICYFGGDPAPFIPHSLRAARLARKNNKRILRVCYETNGSMNRSFVKAMLRIALETGGIIKFDLKAYNDNLHRALTGVSNRQTFNNFAWLALKAKQRKEYPLLVASTVLIPGIIDEWEIWNISGTITGLNPDIPYALLAYHPDCRMTDIPPTSRELAEACLVKALQAGLKNVRLGNIQLIS